MRNPRAKKQRLLLCPREEAIHTVGPSPDQSSSPVLPCGHRPLLSGAQSPLLQHEGLAQGQAVSWEQGLNPWRGCLSSEVPTFWASELQAVMGPPLGLTIPV